MEKRIIVNSLCLYCYHHFNMERRHMSLKFTEYFLSPAPEIWDSGPYLTNNYPYNLEYLLTPF